MINVLDKSTSIPATSVERALTGLPLPFCTMHNLSIQGSLADSDFLVVGPTGVFLVAESSASIDIIEREIAATRIKANALAGIFDKAVIPVVAIAGTRLSQPMITVDNAVVCVVEALVYFIGQGNAKIEMSEIERLKNLVAERAVLLAVVPLVPASMQAPTPINAPAPVPAPPPAPPRVRADLVGNETIKANADRTKGAPKANVVSDAARRRKNIRLRVVQIVLLLAMIPLIVITYDALTKSTGKPNSVPGTTAPGVTNAAITAATTPADPNQTTASVTPTVANPTVAYTPACLTPGAGWTITPAWPGAIANLVAYEYSTQADPTAAFVPIGRLTTAAPTGVVISNVPAGASVNVQFVAIMQDGSMTKPFVSTVAIPAAAC